MNIRLTPEQERLLCVMANGIDVATGEPSDFQALAAKGLAAPMASTDEIVYYMITDLGMTYLREHPVEPQRCSRCIKYAAECTPKQPMCFGCQNELRNEEASHRRKYHE